MISTRVENGGNAEKAILLLGLVDAVTVASDNAEVLSASGEFVDRAGELAFEEACLDGFGLAVLNR